MVSILCNISIFCSTAHDNILFDDSCIFRITLLDNCACRIEDFSSYGPRLRGFANNTDADQPANPCTLISDFVIRFLESIICNLAKGEISIF